MILVKYIAQSGFLSRRKAEQAIREGKVHINHVAVKDPTYEVHEMDQIYIEGTKIVPQKSFYILVHKPTGLITTKSDPDGRSTIFDLLPTYLSRVVDPIGRLDLNTSGALLMSNDGNFVYGLSHPRFNIVKKYVIRSSREISKELVEMIRRGVKLDDGLIKPDKVEWNESNPDMITIELHSGKYRVIRRLLSELGIFIEKLHRVMFGGITLRALPLGKWRELTKDEVRSLTIMVNKGNTDIIKKKEDNMINYDENVIDDMNENKLNEEPNKQNDETTPNNNNDNEEVELKTIHVKDSSDEKKASGEHGEERGERNDRYEGRRDYSRDRGGDRGGDRGDRGGYRGNREGGGYRGNREGGGGDRPFRRFDNNGPRRSFGDRKPEGEGRTEGGENAGAENAGGERPFRRFDNNGPRRSFGDRREGGSGGGYRGNREGGGDRGGFRRFDNNGPRRSFGDRKPEGEGRTEGGENAGAENAGGERPFRRFDNNGPRRSFGDRREGGSGGGYRGNREGGGDRGGFRRFDGPRRPFGDRKPEGEGRTEGGENAGGENAGGERPPFRRFDNNGPRRSFGDRREGGDRGGDRGFRKFDGPRRSFGDRRPEGENSSEGGERPFRKFDKPEFKPFDSSFKSNDSFGNDKSNRRNEYEKKKSFSKDKYEDEGGDE